MIAYLKGIVRQASAPTKKDAFVVVDVVGVGYKVYVLEKFLSQAALGDAVELFIYNQVAEGVLDLYGFATSEELEFFELLISLPGIGPKSAIEILRKAKIDDLKQATQSGNADLLARVSGLGPKTAQKVVTGLKDKLGFLDSGVWDNGRGEALEALVGLGYSAWQAREALGHCQSIDTAEQVREALKILGRK